MTDGGADVTIGGASVRHRRRVAYAVAAAVLVLIAAINALTVAHDTAQSGRLLRAWEPWLWELSSTAYWVAMLPVFGWLALRLRPPQLRWPLALAVHGVLTVPVSAGHIATLFVLRNLAYGLLGMDYDYGLDASQLLYEYRKDVLAYALLVGAAAIIELWVQAAIPGTAMAAAPAGVTAGDFRLEVRDGARTHWLAPDEIDWIEAAGNYVELQTRRGPLLHRATLASVAQMLGGHGFVRIHRSRLIRLRAVRGIESTAAGDFELVLDGGTRVAGSRRFRDAVQAIAPANTDR
ncbi:MAG: LytTR family DNA-binding domain-containing protein [Polymorphobacter sp.]